MYTEKEVINQEETPLIPAVLKGHEMGTEIIF